MRFILLLIFTLLASTVPIAAQVAIPHEMDSPWLHQQSGISVAAQLDGLQRTKILDFGAGEHNVGVQFANEGKKSFATLYIFRAGVVSPSIWADRAMSVMLASKDLGTPKSGTLNGGFFTPPNASGPNSGVIVTTALESGKWKTNGVLLFAHSGWLVKLRLTTDLEQRDAQAMMLRLLAKLGLGNSTAIYPAARLPESCPDSLRTAKKPKLSQEDTMVSLLLGAILSEAMENGLSTPSQPEDYCRDASSTVDYGVYRSRSDQSAYLLALGDTGNSAIVTAFKGARLGGSRIGSGNHLIVLSNGIEEAAFPPLTGLPSPAMARQVLNSVGPMVTRNLLSDNPKNTTITVPPPS